MSRPLLLAVCAVLITGAGAFFLNLQKQRQLSSLGRTAIRLQVCYAKCHTCRDHVGQR
jgi:hypothetical protein